MSRSWTGQQLSAGKTAVVFLVTREPFRQVRTTAPNTVMVAIFYRFSRGTKSSRCLKVQMEYSNSLSTMRDDERCYDGLSVVLGSGFVCRTQGSNYSICGVSGRVRGIMTYICKLSIPTLVCVSSSVTKN